MRVGGIAALAAASVLALAGCSEKNPQGGTTTENSAKRPSYETGSSIKCLQSSTASPKPYDGRDDSDLEPEVKRLMTGNAQAVAILTGTEFGADVIEYTTKDEAVEALSKAKSADLEAKNVTATGRTLFIDYAGDARIRKIVEACSNSPGSPPPA
jgi:hypothetical protein